MSAPDWLRVDPDGVEVDVWVVPGAARTAVTGVHDGRVRVAVAAPPSDGRANRAVEELLAGVGGVARRRVRLVRGARGRAKTCRLEVTGPGERDAVVARLVAASGPVGVDPGERPGPPQGRR